MKSLFQWVICKENIIRWENKSKILKIYWNTLHKNNGIVLCQLYEKYCEQKLENLNKIDIIVVLNCDICGKKKSNFIKNQEASGLLSKLGIWTPLSNIH